MKWITVESIDAVLDESNSHWRHIAEIILMFVIGLIVISFWF